MTTSPTPSLPANRLAQRALAALLLLAIGVAAPAPAVQAPYAQGDEVLFTGVVTSSTGVPIADLQITLEASRAVFSWRQLGIARSQEQVPQMCFKNAVIVSKMHGFCTKTLCNTLVFRNIPIRDLFVHYLFALFTTPD